MARAVFAAHGAQRFADPGSSRADRAPPTGVTTPPSEYPEDPPAAIELDPVSQATWTGAMLDDPVALPNSPQALSPHAQTVPS